MAEISKIQPFGSSTQYDLIDTSKLPLNGGTMTGNIIPNTDLEYSLGSSDKRWKIYGDIPTLILGGRNLLKNTHKEEVQYTYTSSNNYQDHWSARTTIPLYETTYTLSFFAKSTQQNDQITVHFYNPNHMRNVVSSQGFVGTGADGYCRFTLSTEWERYWVTYTKIKGTSQHTVILPRLMMNDNVGTISIMQEKLEAGNKMTDWCPAPEDLAYANGLQANGTWGINITGKAATAGVADSANYLNNDGSFDYTKDRLTYTVNYLPNQNSTKVNDTPYSTNTYSYVLRFTHGNSAGYYTDLLMPLNGNSIHYKQIRSNNIVNSDVNGGWIKVLDQLNYTDYTVTKTGTGASGTWDISISGSAASLTTSRNINGTAFNGTTDITTEKWGTARNVSIADSDSSNTGDAVSVNGSTAITLKLPTTIKATLSGNASTATTAKYLYTGNYAPTYGATRLEYWNSSGTKGDVVPNAVCYPTSDWYHFIRMNHGNSLGYYVEIASCFHNDNMYWRRVSGGTAYNWKRFMWSNGDTMSGPLTLSWNTTATMDRTTTNPRIIFAQADSTQKVGIVYTSYDSYRASKGLKIMDLDNDDASNVWLESQGKMYAPAFVGDLEGCSTETKYFNYKANDGIQLDANEPIATLMSDYGSSGSSKTNVPSGFQYGTVFTIGTFNSWKGSMSGQFAWDVQHNTDNAGKLWFRSNGQRATNTTTGWKNWSEVLLSHTYTNYTVTKTGTGASGTWDISISGTAAKATGDADGNTISSTYLKKSGGTMTGQLKTSFKSSVATGTYEPDQHTIPDLINEVRFSSGCAGSVSITTAYTLNNITIPTGWYNFIWVPHRSGGNNGASSGDNCSYGILYLHHMTTPANGDYKIAYHNTAIQLTRMDAAFISTPTENQVLIASGTKGNIATSGYTIAKSVPSDAKFTDTTYSAGTGITLSGTTFSNSGVRSVTINGDYLKVNTNGTDTDLAIPNSDKLDGYHYTSFFYDGRDYITFSRTLTKNVWKRVLKVNTSNGNSFLFTVTTHHAGHINVCTWLITLQLDRNITITELTGKQHNNGLKIRVSSDSTYIYPAYIDLLKTSTSASSASFGIKAIKLDTNTTFEALDEDDVEALTYSKVIQVGENRIVTTLEGNASTATTLATGRTFQIKDADNTNAGTASSAFNGSANLVINLPGTIKANITGNCSGSSGSCTGNANTATTATNATNIYSSASTSKAYVLGTTTASSANHGTVYNASVYTEGTVLYGAAWNDYAEYRKDNIYEKAQQEPGRCVREIGDGTLMLTTERLQRGCEIISDTFGFAIGQDLDNGYNTPVASSGRVLAYPYESIDEFKNHIGWPVCSGPDGTVSIMTDEEEEHYPSRIIGTISEVPDYEEWGADHVKVNGRIWIRIR